MAADPSEQERALLVGDEGVDVPWAEGARPACGGVRTEVEGVVVPAPLRVHDRQFTAAVEGLRMVGAEQQSLLLGDARQVGERVPEVARAAVGHGVAMLHHEPGLAAAFGGGGGVGGCLGERGQGRVGQDGEGRGLAAVPENAVARCATGVEVRAFAGEVDDEAGAVVAGDGVQERDVHTEFGLWPPRPPATRLTPVAPPTPQ
ncbi:hypothetical protein GCM10010349_25400 [Streptomyces flavofungini]|nr:hypothetical protein GCM10010349_25400 [Streptomyces flavofungini]